MATNWVAVAEQLHLDIPQADVEAIAPLLDNLLEAFRPLVAQIADDY
jgi:hypothetical protein